VVAKRLFIERPRYDLPKTSNGTRFEKWLMENGVLRKPNNGVDLGNLRAQARVKIIFFGTQGSIAGEQIELDDKGVARKIERKLGNNTVSVLVEIGEKVVILDAGTGMKSVGKYLARKGVKDITVLISHKHWDHIQGIPFFDPLYDPKANIKFFGPNDEFEGTEVTVEQILGQQLRVPFFPVQLREALSQRTYGRIEADQEYVDSIIEGVKIIARLNKHARGTALSYRLEVDGFSLAYITDIQHTPDQLWEPALLQAQGADIVIHDCQYDEDTDYVSTPFKRDWGHSTHRTAVELMRRTEAGLLVPFHLEREKDDAEIIRLEDRTRVDFPSTITSVEGMAIYVL